MFWIKRDISIERNQTQLPATSSTGKQFSNSTEIQISLSNGGARVPAERSAAAKPCRREGGFPAAAFTPRQSSNQGGDRVRNDQNMCG
ncbi:hypothetical protein PCANC_11498 [Puccinia coronata f. sp. avenae]|uniref:Uncharacterized protein n=1 Tax=Puccinia coronata f. sp. avenae TaxID=200324 RepID=A0A2N5UW02_9BASI|nr:hypothetical protein PCANC_11498 [Puccinia coronata f. sp. avenae]